jgi:hypothetical protein
MGRTLHYLHRSIIPVFKILCEPYSRKMPPTQLLNQHVSINEHFSNMARMISANLVVLNAFVFAVVFIIKFLNKSFEGSKLYGLYAYSAA